MNPATGLFWATVVPGGSYGISLARFSGPAPASSPGRYRGPPLDYWESGYGLSGRRPSPNYSSGLAGMAQPIDRA